MSVRDDDLLARGAWWGLVVEINFGEGGGKGGGDEEAFVVTPPRAGQIRALGRLAARQ